MRTLPKAFGAAAALSAALNVTWAPPASALVQCGVASWYDEAAGMQAADGGTVDPSALAAAHRFLPFGTRVRVENLANGRATTVAINDRGPFVEGRLIDVTRAAAEQLAFVEGGVARVRITTLETGEEAADDLPDKKCP